MTTFSSINLVMDTSRNKGRGTSRYNMNTMQIMMHHERSVSGEIDLCVSAMCSPVLKFFYLVVIIATCMALFSTDLNVISTIDEYFNQGKCVICPFHFKNF